MGTRAKGDEMSADKTDRKLPQGAVGRVMKRSDKPDRLAFYWAPHPSLWPGYRSLRTTFLPAQTMDEARMFMRDAGFLVDDNGWVRRAPLLPQAVGG